MPAMVSDITSLIAQGQQTKPIEHKQNLDAADFQKLFLEQMTHQDPLAPMEQKDMMAQLAQLMELSRNNETNELLKSMKGMEQVRNRLDSAALLGKQVLADATQVELKGSQGEIHYMLPNNDTGQVSVDIYKDGKLVQRFGYNGGAHFETEAQKQATLGMLTQGVHTIPWNGQSLTEAKATDGTYNVVVRAADQVGMPIQNASAAVAGYVKRVALSGDAITFKVGSTPGSTGDDSITIKPEQIYQILPD
jgi:flagellar basal-body rod modification protein FlgD